MKAMVATLDLLTYNSWFPDLGTTNHVTHDLNNSSSGSRWAMEQICLYLILVLLLTKQREASYSKGGYMKDCTSSICPSSTPSSSVQSSQPTSVLSKKSVQSRSKVCQAFLHFKSQVELLLNKKIKLLQSDCGAEYRPSESPLASSHLLQTSSRIPSSQNHPPIHLEQPSLEPDSISQPAAVAAQNTHPLITRSKDGIYKPKIFTATKSITKPTIVGVAAFDLRLASLHLSQYIETSSSYQNTKTLLHFYDPMVIIVSPNKLAPDGMVGVSELVDRFYFAVKKVVMARSCFDDTKGAVLIKNLAAKEPSALGLDTYYKQYYLCLAAAAATIKWYFQT
ncbi:DNA mismatch repair protein MSH4 [Vitis vinifera]|uniref:DNA mismatch repair protein MSH4 n=1 Tax=Vitis vinifera TaxID=29760 RepID=A0A438K281_VITVI|nr:DNA mismatch repair protein MSH4 [Vitis vinifera]